MKKFIRRENWIRSIFSENDLRESIKTMKIQDEYYDSFSNSIYTIKYR